MRTNRRPTTWRSSSALAASYEYVVVQTAEQYRVRALDVMELLQYLQEFAHGRDPSDLSQLFHQDARMAEAAVGSK